MKLVSIIHMGRSQKHADQLEDTQTKVVVYDHLTSIQIQYVAPDQRTHAVSKIMRFTDESPLVVAKASDINVSTELVDSLNSYAGPIVVIMDQAIEVGLEQHANVIDMPNKGSFSDQIAFAYEAHFA